MLKKTMAYTKLTGDSIETLLEHVKTYPSLYDKTDRDYRNKIKQDSLWQKIGNICDVSGELPFSKFQVDLYILIPLHIYAFIYKYIYMFLTVPIIISVFQCHDFVI